MQGAGSGVETGGGEPSEAADAIESQLQWLAEFVRSRRRVGKGLRTGAFAVIAAWVVAMVSVLIHSVSRLDLKALLLIVPIYGCAFGLLYLLHRCTVAFYNRHEPLLRETVMTLARSGDERAIGPLLDLMNIGTSGTVGWGKARPLFFEAIKLFLSGMTSERFQQLSIAQVKQLLPLIRVNDPVVRMAMRDMLVRCGDVGVLKRIRRLEALSAKAVERQKQGSVNHLVAALPNRMADIFGAQRLDESVVDFLKTCCDAMQARIDEDSGGAQLLRASNPADGNAPLNLLRPSHAEAPSTGQQEWLRAAENPCVQEPAVGVLVEELHTNQASAQETEKLIVNQTRL